MENRNKLKTNMNKLTALGCAVVVTSIISGCVPITYQKTVTTHLDGNGHVTGTDITETISEPHQETPKIESATNSIILNHINNN
jgi:hypothetical protein